jgi:hypothetical protein
MTRQSAPGEKWEIRKPWQYDLSYRAPMSSVSGLGPARHCGQRRPADSPGSPRDSEVT